VELRHVRTFLVLAEELHFGRSARRLHVAQSAVSQTLKALEAEVGAELLARTKRTVRLTDAGERFLDHARQGLRALEQATREARSAASGETGRLILRFVLMSSLTAMPRAVAAFQRAHPGVTLQVEPASTAEQLDAIRAGHCDVGFVAGAGKYDLAPLATEVVEAASLVAVLPSRHRLASRKSVQLVDLAGDRFVFLKQASEPEIFGRFRQRCLAAGFDPDVAIEVEHTEALLGLVAAGLGVSCAPSLIERLHFRGVTTIPLRPTVRTDISAVWHAQHLSATGARFLAVLRAEIGKRAPSVRRVARSGAKIRGGR
jgi:DNA-binding transcriptional LysR family regulator